MSRSPTLSLSLALFLFSLPLCLATPTPPLQNYTIIAPVGTNDHNDTHLICTPARWTDIAVFFLGNYIAHAATVKSLPGETALSTFLAMLFALLFPVSGIIRGVAAIRQHAITRSHPLDKALKAGALCMVVRTGERKPRDGDKVLNVERVLCKNAHHPSLAQLGAGDNIELANTAPACPTGSESSNSKQERPSRVASTIWEEMFQSSGPAFFPATCMMSFRGRKVHGWISLPDGFKLTMLPVGAAVADFDGNEFPDPSAEGGWRGVKTWSRKVKSWLRKVKRTTIRSWLGNTNHGKDINHSRCSKELSSSYSFARGVIAIFQMIFASATLYQTRGDQVNRYGYAAFGLTVVPYLIMSVINLISVVLTPDYPTAYLVSSYVMEEARRHGGEFEGVVGKLIQSEPPPPGSVENDEVELVFGPSCCIDMIAIAIIGGVSQFKSNHSTRAQRVWTMTWLVWGIMGSIIPQKVAEWKQFVPGETRIEVMVFSLSLLLTVLLYSTPAIGGFVVVGQMLQAYGNCYRLY